ncbi:MAG: HAD family phosphatase [Chitinophagales bacterium]|nr:HAD family phosphatase [Chitinophagaceae bacterium]MBP9882278.1 HAD family phosphatase [Chitinophagales bacterium]
MAETPALIFDMDGTMINNMAYHEIAWHQLLQKMGKSLSRSALKPTLFGKNEEVIRRHFGDRFTMEEIAALALEKETIYRTIFQPHLQLIKGLREFLQLSSGEHVQMAIATASDLPNVNWVLDTTNARHYFKVIVTAEQTLRGKPDPEIFLKAAAGLNVKPENCIVFEDVPKGAEAAFRAGMKTVMITSSYAAEELWKLPNVIDVIDHFGERTPRDIIRKLYENGNR